MRLSQATLNAVQDAGAGRDVAFPSIGRQARMTSAQICSAVGFILLIPLFFFYHLAVADRLIPRFLGGWFGFVTVGFAPIAAVLFVQNGRKLWQASPVFSALLIAFFSYSGFHVLLSLLLNSGAAFNSDAAIQVGALFISFVTLIGIGAFLPTQNSLFFRVAMVFWIGMVTLTFALFDHRTLMLNVSLLFGADDVASYQGFARSGLLTSMVLYAMCDQLLKRVAIGIASACLLFLLGARSEFYGFIAIMIAIEGLAWRKSASAMLLVAGAFAISVWLTVSNLRTLAPSRQLQILDLHESSSWIGRQQLQALALDQIKDHPVTGVFGGHFYIAGAGGYAHNALSAWVELGILGFVLYGLVITYPVVAALRGLLRRPESRAWRLALGANLFSMILVATSKPMFWAVPAFGWGIFLCAAMAERAAEVGPIIRRGPIVARRSRPVSLLRKPN